MEAWEKSLERCVTSPEELSGLFRVDAAALAGVVVRYPMRITPYYLGLISGPGDAIYVPPNWHHATLNLGAWNAFVSTFTRETGTAWAGGSDDSAAVARGGDHAAAAPRDTAAAGGMDAGGTADDKRARFEAEAGEGQGSGHSGLPMASRRCARCGSLSSSGRNRRKWRRSRAAPPDRPRRRLGRVQ